MIVKALIELRKRGTPHTERKIWFDNNGIAVGNEYIIEKNEWVVKKIIDVMITQDEAK